MPRRPDQERRTALAAAAFEVLRARGMQTSMRELAEALGLKRPTLYFYFPDLGAVFESVLDQTYRALAEPSARSVACGRRCNDRVSPRAAAFDRRAVPAVGGRRARFLDGARSRA